MTDTIILNVNGIERSISAEADTPLLYILRNDLHLKGTHTRIVRAIQRAARNMAGGTP